MRNSTLIIALLMLSLAAVCWLASIPLGRKAKYYEPAGYLQGAAIAAAVAGVYCLVRYGLGE